MDWLGGFLGEASRAAGQVDTLFFIMVGLCSAVAATIFVLILVFAVRYRHDSKASRAHAPIRGRRIELAWTFIPLTIFMFIFVWAASLYAYVDMLSPPTDSLNVYVVAKQWMWKIQHPNGRREINQLHVPEGRDIKLIMTSQDVIHSFFLPAFRIKHDVLPGTYEKLWFKADKTGTFNLFCAEYCGTDHSKMRGKVIVMEPAAYSRWLAQGTDVRDMATAGAQRFREFGCTGCHGASATVHAPKLAGIYGKPVPLSGGGLVIADEKYIRDSILFPRKQVVAGYAPIMPTFDGQISEQAILELIEYIKSLGEKDKTDE